MYHGAEEMAQWLRALAGPTEDPGLIPSTQMAADNRPQLQLQGILLPFLAPVGLMNTHKLKINQMQKSKNTALEK